MACAWRLPSTASSFHGQVLAPASVRAPWGSQWNGGASVSVRASDGTVLVEKSDAESVYRLKATYLQKIVPLLKEEFSYTNIHQVISTISFGPIMSCLLISMCANPKSSLPVPCR